MRTIEINPSNRADLAFNLRKLEIMRADTLVCENIIIPNFNLNQLIHAWQFASYEKFLIEGRISTFFNF